MKRSLIVQEECQLLSRCMAEKDVWSEVEKKLTDLDMLIMTRVSKTIENFFLQHGSLPFRFHHLKAASKCGSTSVMHSLCCRRSQCCTKIVFRDVDTENCYVLKHSQVQTMSWSIEERMLIMAIELKSPRCPNWRRGDVGSNKWFKLSIPMNRLQEEQCRESSIRYEREYAPEFCEANGMKRVFLSRKKELSDCESEYLTSDLECIVY